MRKLLLATALVAAGVTTAQAQNNFEVLITAPASLQTLNVNIGKPADDGTWGFGNIDNFTPPVTGTVQMVMVPDSLACVALPAGSLQGRIGLAYRGECEFGQKALNMQNAGAVGWILVNNVCAAQPPGMLGGAVGLQVTRPGVMIDKCFFEDQLRQLVRDTALRLTMGNFFGFFSNNLAIDRGTVVSAPATAIPYFMITDTSSFRFLPGGQVFNKGSQASTVTKLKAVITQERNASPGVQTVVYADSIIFAGSVASGDTAPASSQFSQMSSWFPGKGLAVNAPIDGLYRLTYTASNAGQDQAPTDNTVMQMFEITGWGQDAPYSMVRVNRFANFQPSYTNAYTRAGGGAIQFGIPLYTPNIPANTIKADSMMFAVAGSIGNATINLDMWRWNDLDANNTIVPTELTQLASGSYTFGDSASSVYRFVFAPLFDVASGDIGVTLVPNARYLFIVNYTGADQVFIASDEFQDYSLTLAQSGRIGSPAFTTQWFSNGFGADITPSIRISLSDSRDNTRNPLSARARASKLGVALFPNPTTGASALRVGSLTGAVTISITDITGKVVETIRRSVVANQTVDLNTTGLAPGTYNVSIRSAQGSTVTPLIITR